MDCHFLLVLNKCLLGKHEWVKIIIVNIYWILAIISSVLYSLACLIITKTLLCSITQSCSTLWDPIDCSLPDSSVHGISQARILEWVAISFSRGSSQPRNQTGVSCIAGRFFTSWATSYNIRLYWILNIAFSFSFWPDNTACGILVPQTGIEPRPLALTAQSPDCWTTRVFPKTAFSFFLFF